MSIPSAEVVVADVIIVFVVGAVVNAVVMIVVAVG